MAHLTSIHTTKTQAYDILTELRDNGIENVLALRGDRHEELPISTDFTYASDLTKFIANFGGFDICGACYPEGHPESESLIADTMNLKPKIDAGCSHLVTQLFYDNADFYAFRDRMKLADIDVPVEAGIMPVVNKKQIERTVSMCGASLPRKFTHMMSRYENNPEALFDAGIAYAVDQIIDLIANGVDGIHLYAMNNPRVAHLIYNRIRTVLDASNESHGVDSGPQRSTALYGIFRRDGRAHRADRAGRHGSADCCRSAALSLCEAAAGCHDTPRRGYLPPPCGL